MSALTLADAGARVDKRISYMADQIANAPPAWTEPVSPSVALSWAVEFAEGRRGPTDFVRVPVPAVRGMNRRFASPSRLEGAEVLLRLRAEVSEMLSALASGSEFEFEPRVRLRLWRPRYIDAGEPFETSLGPDAFVQVTGALRDVFLFKIAKIVEVSGAGMLRICPSHPCAKLFVRRGRQEYCSGTCKMRRYMREKRLEEAKERHRLGISGHRAEGRGTPVTPKLTPKRKDARGRGAHRGTKTGRK